MAQFDHRDDLMKSGLRRLRDAEELLQNPTLLSNESGAEVRHTSGARYLSGYAVECLTKVYLIAHEPGAVHNERLSVARDAINARRARQGREPIRDICSVAGHDISYLLGLTDMEARFDAKRRAEFDLCARWRSNWRYDPQVVSVEEAQIFVSTARSVADWLLPQV